MAASTTYRIWQGQIQVHQLVFVFVQAKKDGTLNLFPQGGNQTGFDVEVLYHYKQ